MNFSLSNERKVMNKEELNEGFFQVKNVTKVYPNGVVANKDVCMSIKEGEIHALIGENGAGKSTLMKILFGIEMPDSGSIILKGKEVHIRSPKEAINLGIGMVHQHFMLVDSLSIAENIALGDEPTKCGLFLKRQDMVKQAKALAETYSFNIDVKEKIENVSVGIKQETEILKALARGAKILILDEPTAVLTPQECKSLFKELKELKKKGHTILFISHKLNEIMEICDRVTIMKHGRTVTTLNIDETSPEDISRRMVGRDVELHIEKKKAVPGEVLLDIKNLTYINSLGKKKLDDLSLAVRAGQIVSVAGVEGNGQAELANILTGLREPLSGEVKISGEKVSEFSPKSIRSLGLSYVPEDRMTVGTAPDMSIEDNLLVTEIDKFLRHKFFIDKNKVKQMAEEKISEFVIACQSPFQKVSMLSGGNIQKVVAARELFSESKVIIAEQPTRGIDAGAAELIRKYLIKLRDDGAAILLISADLNEVLELGDSCAVLYNGRLTAYFEDTKDLTEEELGYYMLGVKQMNLKERTNEEDV